jgi:hypothetical protein
LILKWVWVSVGGGTEQGLLSRVHIYENIERNAAAAAAAARVLGYSC